MGISFQKYFLHISIKDISNDRNQQSKKESENLNHQYQHNLITILGVHNHKVFNFAYYQQFVNRKGKDCIIRV